MVFRCILPPRCHRGVIQGEYRRKLHAGQASFIKQCPAVGHRLKCPFSYDVWDGSQLIKKASVLFKKVIVIAGLAEIEAVTTKAVSLLIAADGGIHFDPDIFITWCERAARHH